MTPKMCYPVFTNAHTSSIGIDELQMLLLKTALLVGVDFKLGVGYEDAKVDIAVEYRSTNQRPSWMATYSADDIAVERYGLDKSGTGQERFDALFGCDGGNSRVRKTQVEWLGEPQTRIYKKMFGIVSNLRKCSRARLKELGFDRGLEPEDKAGQTTGVYFYKASYHNYFIVHPPKEEMEANGIPWKAIYTFDKARDPLQDDEAAAVKADEEAQLKSLFKRYMTKKAKQLGIPIDESAENEGFVSPPNDVMGFDFSTFYNCEKSAAVYVPPLDWDVKKDGEWVSFEHVEGYALVAASNHTHFNHSYYLGDILPSACSCRRFGYRSELVVGSWPSTRLELGNGWLLLCRQSVQQQILQWTSTAQGSSYRKPNRVVAAP